MASTTKATDDNRSGRRTGNRRRQELPIAHEERRESDDRRSGRDRRTEPRT